MRWRAGWARMRGLAGPEASSSEEEEEEEDEEEEAAFQRSGWSCPTRCGP